MNDFVMTVRAVQDGRFMADIGPTQYLCVPETDEPSPSHSVSAQEWFDKVRSAAVWVNKNGAPRGDILFIVHGYNMSEVEIMQRHRRIRDDLFAEAFKGVVVSFDWPSDNKTLAYLPDRHRAKMTAFQLVSDGIRYLSANQRPDCTINVHILGHSTGAYVIREAFDDADDTGLTNASWNVSQILFAAGDVSSISMSSDDSGAESVYRHCVRLTNYFSRHDEALDLSNVKRLGIKPRVGRIGLPSNLPPSALDVDCTSYYEALTADDSSLLATDSPNGFVGLQSHSWYFGNKVFTKDLFNTLIGINRTTMETRAISEDGTIKLVHAP
jgi:esterase/lipase superfamily enzyme